MTIGICVMTKRPSNTTLIMDRFGTRTIAHMEMALERACRTLPKSNDNYKARRYIASRILEYAQAGDHTLGGMTEAGHMGASELAKGRDVDVKPPGETLSPGADAGPAGFDWR
jgi:hypothetical protein